MAEERLFDGLYDADPNHPDPNMQGVVRSAAVKFSIDPGDWEKAGRSDHDRQQFEKHAGTFTVRRWFKHVGQTVKQFELIALAKSDLGPTEKRSFTLRLYAPAAGTLEEITAFVSDPVKVGDTIATIRIDLREERKTTTPPKPERVFVAGNTDGYYTIERRQHQGHKARQSIDKHHQAQQQAEADAAAERQEREDQQRREVAAANERAAAAEAKQKKTLLIVGGIVVALILLVVLIVAGG